MRYLIKLHAVQNYRSAHIRAGDDCASAGGAHDARDAESASTATQSLSATENVCGSACESAKNDCKRDDGVPWDYCVDHSGASQLQAIRLVLEPAWTLLP